MTRNQSIILPEYRQKASEWTYSDVFCHFHAFKGYGQTTPKSLFYAIIGLFNDRQATLFTFIAAKVSLPAFHPSLFFNDTQKSYRQIPVLDLPTNEKQGAFKTPCFFGLYNGACRVRTCDLLIKSQLLSQLS